MDRTPVAGDWDGDGRDDVGLYTPATGEFSLYNRSTGVVEAEFNLQGPHCGLPIVGDWDQDGVDTVGLFIVDDNEFLLAERNIEGGGNYASFYYNPPGRMPIPLAGDWNGPVWGERGWMAGFGSQPRGGPNTMGPGARISTHIPTGQPPLCGGTLAGIESQAKLARQGAVVDPRTRRRGLQRCRGRRSQRSLRSCGGLGVTACRR